MWTGKPFRPFEGMRTAAIAEEDGGSYGAQELTMGGVCRLELADHHTVTDLVVPNARVDGTCSHRDPHWVIRRAGGHYPAAGGQIVLGHAQSRQFAARFRV